MDYFQEYLHEHSIVFYLFFHFEKIGLKVLSFMSGSDFRGKLGQWLSFHYPAYTVWHHGTRQTSLSVCSSSIWCPTRWGGVTPVNFGATEVGFVFISPSNFVMKLFRQRKGQWTHFKSPLDLALSHPRKWQKVIPSCSLIMSFSFTHLSSKCLFVVNENPRTYSKLHFTANISVLQSMLSRIYSSIHLTFWMHIKINCRCCTSKSLCISYTRILSLYTGFFWCLFCIFQQLHWNVCILSFC